MAYCTEKKRECPASGTGALACSGAKCPEAGKQERGARAEDER